MIRQKINNSMITEQQLKPCPFCGKFEFPKLIHEVESTAAGPTYSIYCSHCFAKGPRNININEAIKEWNNRAYENN